MAEGDLWIAAMKGGHNGTKELCFCCLLISLIYLNQLCFWTSYKNIFLLCPCSKNFRLQIFFFFNDLRNKNCNGNVKIILTTSGQTSEEKALKSCLQFFFLTSTSTRTINSTRSMNSCMYFGYTLSVCYTKSVSVFSCNPHSTN